MVSFNPQQNQYVPPQTAMAQQMPSNAGIYSAPQAQMPAPEMKATGTAQGKDTVELNKPKPTPPDVGILQGPSNYPKTPITDSINRQKAITPRTAAPIPQEKLKLPSAASKKRMKPGSISALLGLGSLGTIIFMCAAKIIKHK